MSAQMADFNAQTTEGAPLAVRILAALDQRHLAGVVGNTILDGVKGLGGGIRRVFGRGRSTEAPPDEAQNQPAGTPP
jgi:hypothetical protein